MAFINSNRLRSSSDKVSKNPFTLYGGFATNTEYATMITSPRYERNKLKFIQLSRVDEHQLVAVIVVEGNIIRNNILEVSEEMEDESLLKLFTVQGLRDFVRFINEQI